MPAPSPVLTDVCPTRAALPVRDGLSFLRSWIRDPGRVGAITPSGAALAGLITREIDAATGPVLELGPGTGVFTRALLARGVRQQDLVLVESGADFARMLQARFPLATVLCASATRLPRRDLLAPTAVGAVVSGLPLRNMSRRQIVAILVGAFRQMRPDGAFYQFTYGARFPLPRPYLDRWGFKAVRVGRALANLPPAAVYRVTRRAPSRLAAL